MVDVPEVPAIPLAVGDRAPPTLKEPSTPPREVDSSADSGVPEPSTPVSSPSVPVQEPPPVVTPRTPCRHDQVTTPKVYPRRDHRPREHYEPTW